MGFFSSSKGFEKRDEIFGRAVVRSYVESENQWIELVDPNSQGEPLTAMLWKPQTVLGRDGAEWLHEQVVEWVRKGTPLKGAFSLREVQTMIRKALKLIRDAYKPMLEAKEEISAWGK